MVLQFIKVFYFGEAEVGSSCRRSADRGGVSRVIYSALLVMYSHHSHRASLSLILTLLTITVNPPFLSIYPPVSLLLPSMPWRFIVALTERPLPSPSECWEGCISRISDSAVSFLQRTQIQCLC